MIYLDNAATTKVSPDVVEAMLPIFSSTFGNPSSIHKYGREARHALEEARKQVAIVWQADPSGIIFTSGGTEGDNIAIKGSVLHWLNKGKNHLVISKAEHPAVLRTAEYLADAGIHVTRLDVDRYGQVDPDAVKKALSPRTALVAIMHVNNETGAVNDVVAIAEICRDHDVDFHTDATQGFGKIPLAVCHTRVNFAVASAHKLHGPKGIGALFVARDTGMEPLFHGGHQEQGRRGGTENVALAVGFARAAVNAMSEREERMERFGRFRSALLEGLLGEFPGLQINSPENGSPAIVNVSFPHGRYPLDGEALIMNLDLEGLAVSSGSACASGSVKPSHVLLAAGVDEATALASLRFSFGKDTTMEEIREAVEITVRVVKRLHSRR